MTMAKKARPDVDRPDPLLMLLVHRTFREEFAALARETAGAGDGSRDAALEDQLGLMLRVLHEHHTGEDTMMWPLVRSRAPESAAVLDAMEAEHEELDPLIERAGDTRVPLAERADALAGLSERLTAHLDREEREALPLVERYLTGGEFTGIEEAQMKGLGRDLPALAGAVLWHATPRERELALALAPSILGIM
jgi:iron-sulfur cluster repair protein YtfE (RIC family)